MSVAGITANLTANTTRFHQGIQNATKDLRGLASYSAKVGGAISGAFKMATSPLALIAGGLGAGLAVHKVVSGIQDAAAALDDVGKKADVFGTSAESLQAFRYAGDLAGASVEAVDTAVGKFIQNAGKGAKVFESLGLSAAKLASQDTVTAVGEVADRLIQLPNAAQRATAAIQIFGKGGLALVPTLMGGSAGLREMADEAKQFGLAIDRYAIARVEQMNDSFTKVKWAMKGAFEQVAVAVAPFVTGAVTKLTDWLKGGGGIAAKVSAGINLLIRGISRALDLWRVFELGVLKVRVSFSEMAISAVAAVNAVSRKLDPKATDIDTAPMYESLMKAAAQWIDLTNAPLPSEKFKDWGKGLVEKANAISESAIKVSRAVGSMPIEDLDDVAAPAEKLAKTFNDVADRASTATDGVKDLARATQSLMGGSGSWLTTAFSMAGVGGGGRGRGAGGGIPHITPPQINVPHIGGNVGISNGMATYGGAAPSGFSGGGAKTNPELMEAQRSNVYLKQVVDLLLAQNRVGKPALVN